MTDETPQAPVPDGAGSPTNGAAPDGAAAAAGEGPQVTTETEATGSETDANDEPRRRRGPDLTDDALRAIIKDAARQSRTGHVRPRRICR